MLAFILMFIINYNFIIHHTFYYHLFIKVINFFLKLIYYQIYYDLFYERKQNFTNYFNYFWIIFIIIHFFLKKHLLYFCQSLYQYFIDLNNFLIFKFIINNTIYLPL